MPQKIAIIVFMAGIILLILGLIMKRLNRRDYYLRLTIYEPGIASRKDSFAVSKIIVGRDPALSGRNSLCLMDPFVSRKHFKILLRKDGVYIVDLKSVNGTYLVGKSENQSLTQKKEDIEPIPQEKLTRFSLETSDIVVGNTKIEVEKVDSRTLPMQ